VDDCRWYGIEEKLYNGKDSRRDQIVTDCSATWKGVIWAVPIFAPGADTGTYRPIHILHRLEVKSRLAYMDAMHACKVNMVRP